MRYSKDRALFVALASISTISISHAVRLFLTILVLHTTINYVHASNFNSREFTVPGGMADDEFFGIARNARGDLIAVGAAWSPKPKIPRAWIVHIDSSGGSTTELQLGASLQTANSRLYDVIDLPDGDFVAAGYLVHNRERPTTRGSSQDGLVLRFTHDGKIRWIRRIFHETSNRLVSLARLKSGDIVAVGRVLSVGTTKPQVWAVTLETKTGRVLKKHSYTFGYASGGTSIAAMPDGGFILSGWVTPEVDAKDEGLIVWLDKSGTVKKHSVWLFEDAGVILYKIGLSPIGDVVGIGYVKDSTTGTNDYDGFILQVDGDTHERKFAARIPGSVDSRLSALTILSDGAIIGAGSNAPDYSGAFRAWLVHYSATGEERGEYKFGNDLVNRVFDIAEMGDGRFALVGSALPTGNRHFDGWLSIAKIPNTTTRGFEKTTGSNAMSGRISTEDKDTVIQAALQRLGLYSGPSHGEINSGTRIGIRVFQALVGDPPTGSLTERQFSRLLQDDPLEIDSPARNDHGANQLEDATPFDAASNHPPSSVNDWVGLSDPHDYFKLSMSKKAPALVALTENRGDVDLELLDNNGRLIATSNNGSSAAEAIRTTLSAGVYYIHVFPLGAGSPYRLTVSFPTSGDVTTAQSFSGLDKPSEDPDARPIELALRLLGYKFGPADGFIDGSTRHAIEAFQIGLGADPTRFLTHDQKKKLLIEAANVAWRQAELIRWMKEAGVGADIPKSLEASALRVGLGMGLDSNLRERFILVPLDDERLLLGDVGSENSSGFAVVTYASADRRELGRWDEYDGHWQPINGSYGIRFLPDGSSEEGIWRGGTLSPLEE